MKRPACEYECQFESQALAAALQSRWPDRVDAELREHISMCRICSDVIAVAGSIDAARDHLRAEAAVPDSGRVWWLAQLRARREAAKAAGRPITAAQVLAFACAVALLGACFGATSTWFQAALNDLMSAITGFGFQSLALLFASHGLLTAAMVALALLLPTALYLAVGRD